MVSDVNWLNALVNLPGLPAEEVQRAYVGQAGRAAFEQALKVYSFALEQAALHTNDPVFLDFGCGWGRFTRVALRDFPPERIWSVDASPEAVMLCKNSGLKTNLALVPSFPPTQLEPQIADLIIAYSVFSHLREDYHLAWVDELHRLLKPGGTLVATTFGAAHIEYLLTLQTTVSQLLDLGGVEDFASGKFVFLAPHTSGPLAGFFGHAFVPKAFIEREWRKRFANVTVHQEDAIGGTNQISIVARR